MAGHPSRRVDEKPIKPFHFPYFWLLGFGPLMEDTLGRRGIDSGRGVVKIRPAIMEKWTARNRSIR